MVDRNPKWHFASVERFNGKTFLSFLKRLANHYRGRKPHLVVDNARYHRSREIQKWLQSNINRIAVHFLPPYSPEFNPVELVWKETKKRTTHNRYFPSLTLLKQKLFRRFNRYQGNPASLRKIVASFV